MIKRAKNKLAVQQIIAFIEKMQQMGFEKKETLALINKMLEEMEI
jgi:DNA-binding transcriptional regulator YhcF (GntR family)